MMILKLEVENFKSYGGVKEIGPFHKSFSSVVGPNGSGKSNVIDCMLFVFGKKSSKLRLNKVCIFLWRWPLLPILIGVVCCDGVWVPPGTSSLWLAGVLPTN